MKRTRSLILIVIILIIAVLLAVRFRASSETPDREEVSPAEEAVQSADPPEDETEEDELQIDEDFVVELQDDEVIEIG